MLYVASLLCVSASAVGMNAETGPIDTSNLNELSVRLVVNAYFEQRLAYLKGEGEAITAANIPMGNDEAEHKACLEANNIAILDSTVVLDTIECWGNLAFVSATETASFLMNREVVQEIINHTIRICNVDENTLLLQSDAYIENTSGFESCSYVSPESAPPAELQALQGGISCIVAVALKEKEDGNGVRSDGTTKYGAWYGQHVYGNEGSAAWGAWCAMFVSWCAHYSDISTDIIPCIWNAPGYRNHFVNQGRYHSSSAYGGTYTPKVGDIFFEDGSPGSPEHVGIVQYVTSNAIGIIDGNNTSQVASRVISLTDSSLVAFADPAYSTYSHTSSSAWTTNSQYHWKTCVHCGLGEMNKGAHTMTWNDALQKSCCSVCYYDGFILMEDPVETERE